MGLGSYALKATLGLESGQFESALGKMGKKGKGFGNMLGTAVKAGVVAAGAAIAAFAVKGVKDFLEMEKKAREVFTLIPEAGNKMRDQLVAGATDISNAYGKDVTEVLDGMYSALSAGIPKENVVDFLRVAADAARGGVANLADAVGAITTVLNSYQMEASKAVDVSDTLFVTVKKGETNFTALGANIGKVTPLASALGISFQETASMFAALTVSLGRGKTAEAGTQIKSMLAELGKEGAKASDAFKELTGVSFKNFIARGGDVQGALRLMSEGAEANGQSITDMFGSIEAGMGALSLATDGAKVLTETMEEMEDRMGSTKEAAEEVGQSGMEKLAEGFQQVKNAGIAFGEKLAKLIGGSGILEQMVGMITTLAGRFGGLTEKGEILDTLMGVLAATFRVSLKVVSTLWLGFENGLNVINLVIKIIGEFIGSIKDMGMAAFGPIIQAVESAMLAFKAFGKVLKDPFDVDAWGEAKDLMGQALDGMVDSLETWGTDFTSAFEKRQDRIGKHWDDFVDKSEEIVGQIEDVWNEEGDWAFLNPDKIEKSTKELDKAADAAAKQAEAIRKQKEEEAKKAELARQQEELARQQMEIRRKQAQEEARIKALQEAQKAAAERVKMLEEKKKELLDKQKERREQINALLTKEMGIHQQALGIVDQLLQKEGLRHKEKKMLQQIQAKLAKDEQVARDATKEGFEALQKQKDALLLIQKTEREILKANLEKEGLGPKMIEHRLKEHEGLKKINLRMTEVNTRIKKAKEHQQEFNQKLPPAQVMVGKVAMGAKKLEAEINKAKARQVELKTKTQESVKGFTAMKEEGAKLEEGLKQVGDELESMKFGIDELKVDTGDADKLPEHIGDAKDKLQEFNDLSAENELVKLANAGKIKVDVTDPIPVTLDDALDPAVFKDLVDAINDSTTKPQLIKLGKVPAGQLKTLAQGSRDMLKAVKSSEKHLKSIDKTVKGYFVNQ